MHELEAMHNTRKWLSQGGGRGEISPPPTILGGAFFIRTIKYHNLSLSEFNENEQCTMYSYKLWRAHAGSAKVNFSPQAALRDSRGQILGPRGPLESRHVYDSIRLSR